MDKKSRFPSITLYLILIISVLPLASCQTNSQTIKPTPTESILPSSTIPTATQPVPTPTYYTVSLDANLPVDFLNQVKFSDEFVPVSSGEADLKLSLNCGSKAISNWAYSLVAPFATIQDRLTLSELQKLWKDSKNRIAIPSDSKEAFSSILGSPGKNVVVVDTIDAIADSISNISSWAIVPFDKLRPDWKVLRIDGISPLDKQFNPSTYGLSISICLNGKENAIKALETSIAEKTSFVPSSNRVEDKLTFLLMSGTTALTRDIARKMDANGVNYPAEKILPWFQSADLVHISNEVSFRQDCNLNDRLLFCSKLAYFDLLKAIGANIIESTGNHLIDYGADPFLQTVKLYSQNAIGNYGGGQNLEDARKPLLIDKNSNKLAFLGCNAVGPDFDLATATTPGANPCDRDWMKTQINSLTTQGYNVIVTYQDLEGCDPVPPPSQRGNFIFAADAGAVIVSGSQAHCPQAMEFRNGRFIHYGLGNLFFDQMDELSRQEFLDRYTFYDNHLISIQLLTAELEDSSQPRPMTDAERTGLLTRIFIASGWDK